MRVAISLPLLLYAYERIAGFAAQRIHYFVLGPRSLGTRSLPPLGKVQIILVYLEPHKSL